MKMVTGLFLPSLKIQVGSSRYISDRGASFDQQLIDNLGVFGDRRVGDYIDLEEQAVIPQMIFSPVVINDGRKMYISGMSATYLTRNFDYRGQLQDAITEAAPNELSEYAQDTLRRGFVTKYLQDMKDEEVYPVFGHTYDYCVRHEINLGLDLQP